MIVSAAELLRQIKAEKRSNPILAKLEDAPKIGRPRLHKRCQATAKGTCFQPLSSPLYCKGHKWRLERYGDLYAGRWKRHKKEHCKNCDKQVFIVYQMINGVRKNVVDEHYTRAGTICRGSGYAPVRARREWKRI